MRKVTLLVTGLILGQNLPAQNVCIGTATQAAKLDLKTTCSYVGQFNGGSSMLMGIFENYVYRGYWDFFAGNPEDIDFGTGAGNAAVN